MHDNHANHDRRYGGKADKLRSPERLALLQVDQVVTLCLEGSDITQVLDVGTGTGVFAEAFAQKNLQVAGLDLREDLLAIAREHVPAGDFRLGKMEELPYANDEFDLVFLGHVLHEADDLRQALQEAQRVTRQRIAVLEWPYQEQEMGPPMHHRLQPSVVVDIAEQLGFTKINEPQLEHMTLFIFDV